jgi:outer membrane protein insertion porin family
VVRILVEGAKRYTEAQIIAALGQRLGEPLDEKVVDQGVKRLWTTFHVRAEPDVRAVPGGVELRLRVFEMPVDREPRFVGNDQIDTKTLRRWALIEEQTELYLHQAKRVRQRILEGYQREGFHFAEVDVIQRGEGADSDELPDVIFEIREGPKVRVKDVVIRGNESMPDTRFLYFFAGGLSHLAKRELRGPGILNWKGSAFVRETLEADLLAMRQVYRDRGWLDAVVELERLEFNELRDGVVIHVLVDEGQRYRVSSLSIRAVDWVHPEQAGDERTSESQLVFPEEELLEATHLGPGDWYEKVQVDRDRAALRTLYGKRGYIAHASLPRRSSWEFLEPPELVFDPAAKTVAVTYRIVQGRPLRLREILVAGTTHTRDRVLRRELSVFPGEQANLTEIHRSLDRIRATDFFSDPRRLEEHRQPYFRFLQVEEDPSLVDLEYIVDEGNVVDLVLSGGVESNAGAFGIVRLTMRNFDISDPPSSFASAFTEIYHKEAFHGAGQRLDIEVAPGTEVSRFRLRFVEPDLFRLHLQPIGLELDFLKRLRIYKSHDEDRLEKHLKLSRKLSHDLFTWLGYVHTDVEAEDLDDDGVPALLAAQELLGKTSLSGVTFDVVARSLDKVTAPTDGWNLKSNSVVYGGYLGEDWDFVQTELRGDFFRPMGEKADGTKHVLFVGVDAGVAQPYGDTDDVPYTERFFIGGLSGPRGFAFRGIDIDPASDFAKGGETYARGTFEYRYPLHSIVVPGSFERQETLRAAAFVDWGMIDTDPFQLELDELRLSVGFGIGLSYPIPLIFNFGFPIRSQDDDKERVFSFSLSLY